MHIESGSSTDRHTRVFIFLLMCVAFSLWFAYDGFIGYPRKNLNWARQALPEQPAGLRADPRVTSTNLDQLLRMSQGRKNGTSPEVTREQIEGLLGVPAVEQKRELRYDGTDAIATVRIDDGKVVDLARAEVKPDQRPKNPNFRVRPERLDRIRPGLPEAAVKDELGEPTAVQEKRLWFVGPAAYATAEIKDGKLIGEPSIHKNTEPSEGDIFIQKVIAMGLAAFSVVMAVKVVQALRLRVVVDDEGLLFNARRIRWDDMSGLRTEDYASKGWVDLLYSGNRSLRLDSYHLDRFNDVVGAICERQGYAPPVLPKSPEHDTP